VTLAVPMGLPARGCARVESPFLNSLADGTFWPFEQTRDDHRRAAQLVLEYASLPLGTADVGVLRGVDRMQRDPPVGVEGA